MFFLNSTFGLADEKKWLVFVENRRCLNLITKIRMMMKRILTGVFALMCGVLPAQTDKRIESKITEVVVFLNRAQVSRVAQARIEPGKTNLVLSGLTAQLDPQSIQVSGKGTFTILGISHQKNFMDEFSTPPGIKRLKDSVEFYSDQMKIEQNLQEITTREEQLLLNNQKIGGTDSNLTVAELKAMADFYRSRLAEISLQRMKHEKQVGRLQEKIGKLQHQLREQNDLMSRNTSEVIVSLSSKEGGTVALELNYVVSNAGWMPIYDIRATGHPEPVRISYKARVQQRTGEDWRDVKLTLSTGNPALGGNRPDLQPWYIDLYQPMVRSPKYKREAAPTMLDGYVAGVEIETSDDSISLSEYTEVSQTALNTEFTISLPYTVHSSGVPTVVDVAMHQLAAEYTYYVTPKLDTDAFLVARLGGWEELSLLPGEANVFMDGSFVGKTFINPDNVADSLSVSLGRDKRIVVKYDKVKDLTSRRLIGSSQREAFAFDIRVRNTRDQAITLVIEDQIPVSRNGQIEVSLTEGGGGRHESATGRLEWHINMKPGEQKTMHYRYEIKYPKDKRLSGL